MSINVYQRKDGRFEGRITTEKIVGKRKYKAFLGKTADEVMQKITNFHSVTACKNCEIKLFSVIYAEWFTSVSYRIKESTAANYTLKADKHILPAFGSRNIADISQNSIYQFIREKQDCGLSNRYITDILILMKSVFKFASRTYHIVNPMDGIIMPKKHKTEIKLLMQAEEQKLMNIIVENQTLTTMGILNPPKYVLSIFSYQESLAKYEIRVKNTQSKAVRDKAEKYLDALRRALDKADGLDVIFDKHMTDRTGKYIIFCANFEAMQDAIGKTDEWFGKSILHRTFTRFIPLTEMPTKILKISKPMMIIHICGCCSALTL